MADPQIKAVITAEDRASKTINEVGMSFGKMAGAMAAGQIAADLLTSTMNKITDSVKAAVSASWSQVDSVQQATLAFRAYETNGDKVNSVLKSLIAYARSDLGVLFNRKDLFDAAQQLKIMGDNTDNITDHVKIMSRSVGLGLSTWDGLGIVIKRVGATGKLYADDLQYLQTAGFKLDSSLSGSTQTFESLFKLLDKGIPTNALEGQSRTIKGLGIRMETAFRGIGDAILGVDADTSQFIQGGLGDRLTKGLASATQLLKNLKQPIADLMLVMQKWGKDIQTIASKVGDYLLPKLKILWGTIQQAMPTFKQLYEQVLQPLAKIIGEVLVIAFGLLIDAINAFMKVITPVIQWMLDNKITVITFAALFTALGIAMNFSGIVAAFMGSMDLVIGKIVATKTAAMDLSTFLTGSGAAAFGVIAAAAIIAAALIIDAGNRTKAAWDSASAAVKSAQTSDLSVIKQLKDLKANGTPEQKARATKTLQGLQNTGAFASGTDFAPGGMALVGEKGPELVNLPRGSQVVPNNKIGGSPINITVQAGAFMGNHQDARRYAQLIVDSIQDIASMKGQSPSQVLGM